MTLEQQEVALSGNLTALMAMVPSEVNASALMKDYGRFKVTEPLLIAVLASHKYTDEGHAMVQYLLEQGADPNVLGAMVNRAHIYEVQYRVTHHVVSNLPLTSKKSSVLL